MYKNQLQELAQRSCFNLPSYSCIREGPDHAPRFKATVNFNGETFESPSFCSTLRQAEHGAAEVALNTLASRGPSRALAARVLDETGVYKNLLQETTHRAGLKLPLYSTVRSGPGHGPGFSCKVELAGMSFTGEPARTKKQAQKNAAMAAWSALKKMVQKEPSASGASLLSLAESKRSGEEQEQVIIARFLASSGPSDLEGSTQCDCQKGDEKLTHVSKEMRNPRKNNFFLRGGKKSTHAWNSFVSLRPMQIESQRGDSSPSSYPFQYQSWNFPCFSPEMAIWQSQQEHLLSLQSCLSMLQVPPRPPVPQLPFMQSVFPLYAAPRFAVAPSEPSPLSLNHPPTDSIVGKSTVTIQEIPEEKIEETPKCSFSVAHNPIKEENKKKNPGLDEKVESFQPGGSQVAQFSAASVKPVNFEAQQNPCGFISSQSTSQYLSRPSSSRTHVPSILHNLDTDPVHRDDRNNNCKSDEKVENFQLGEMQTSQFMASDPHGFINRHPPSPSSSRNSRSSIASPVVIRATGHISTTAAHSTPARNMRPASSIPRPQDLVARAQTRGGVRSHSCSMRGVQPSFVAPPVRIRTVVPVCSAPPTVKAAKNEDMGSEVATANSELGKLRIRPE